ATDVAYSLNYDRAAGSDVAFAFTGVKSVTATDPHTVTVTVTAPDASWKFVPAEENAYIFEKAFKEAHASTFGQPGTLVMGSGPWVVDSLDFLGSKNLQAGGWNFANYAPAAVDTLLAQGVATSSPAQRFAVYSKLFERLQEDEPYVGLFVSDTVAALSSK